MTKLPEGTDEHVSAWEAVKGCQFGNSRQTWYFYSSHLRDTYALPNKDGTIRVVVRSERERMWMTERFKQAATRLLVGILNKPPGEIFLHFVVGADVEARLPYKDD